MMKVIATITGLGLAALALVGCASSGSDTPVSGGSPGSDTPTGPGGVCDILWRDDIDAALGDTFGDGTPRSGQVTVDDVEWTTTGCRWEGEAMEVVASFARGDAFPAGFACVEPSTLDGEVSPLDELGSLAWWTWDDFQGGTGVAIVCGDDIRVEVDVTGPRDGQTIDETAARGGATTLAARLLASLG